MTILLTSIAWLTACSLNLQRNKYYQYYVGNIKIENPVVVEIGVDSIYVCPDSILYCCNDSDWLCRDEVYPYLLFVDVDDYQNPTYFPRKRLSQLGLFQNKYIPFHENGQINGYPIYRFYYNVNTFECYMQAMDECWFGRAIDIDIDYPMGEYSGSYDDSNNLSQTEKTYRLVVRQKNNIFQIMTLKQKYKDYLESNPFEEQLYEE